MLLPGFGGVLRSQLQGTLSYGQGSGRHASLLSSAVGAVGEQVPSQNRSLWHINSFKLVILRETAGIEEIVKTE